MGQSTQPIRLETPPISFATAKLPVPRIMWQVKPPVSTSDKDNQLPERLEHLLLFLASKAAILVENVGFGTRQTCKAENMQPRQDTNHSPAMRSPYLFLIKPLAQK